MYAQDRLTLCPTAARHLNILSNPYQRYLLMLPHNCFPFNKVPTLFMTSLHVHT